MLDNRWKRLVQLNSPSLFLVMRIGTKRVLFAQSSRLVSDNERRANQAVAGGREHHRQAPVLANQKEPNQGADMISPRAIAEADPGRTRAEPRGTQEQRNATTILECFHEVKLIFERLRDLRFLAVRKLPMAQKIATAKLLARMHVLIKRADDLFWKHHDGREDPDAQFLHRFLFSEMNTWEGGIRLELGDQVDFLQLHLSLRSILAETKHIAQRLQWEADDLFEQGTREIWRQSDKMFFRNYSKGLLLLEQAAELGHPGAAKSVAILRAWEARTKGRVSKGNCLVRIRTEPVL